MKDKNGAADGPLADGPALDALQAEGDAMQPPTVPPAAGAVVDADAIPSGELCKMVLGPFFAIFCPNWNVGATEVDQLGMAYGAVLDKYFPGGFGAYGPEITAVMCTAMMIGPRLNTPRVKAPPKAEKSAADAPAG